MSSGSRFVAAAIAALVVSIASAGFVVARRSGSHAPVSSPVAATEPTPAATPSPMAPSPVAAPAESPAAVAPASTPAPEATISKATSPKVLESAPRKKPAPARNAARTRPVTNTDAPRSAAMPVPEPVIESPAAARPAVTPAPVPVTAPAPVPTVDAPVEAPRRVFEEHTVKADSVMAIRINQSLSSATAKVEDRVTAVVSNDVVVDGRTVVPSGSRLEGTVTVVQPGSKFKGRARLGIRFHTLVLDGGMRVPIQTEALYRDGDSATGATATKVGGGAAAGAIFGGLLGGKHGAIIGGTIGAGGGTAAVMAGDAKEAVLPSDSQLSMRLTAPVTITVEK